jgi:hypothetical protein
MPKEPLPPDLQAILDQIARSTPFLSEAALNRLVLQRLDEYNRTPQVELGGLSPHHVAQLLHGDWATQGAMRVSGEAPPAQLLNISIVADARAILAFVAENAPLKLTAKGNLSRAAVETLVPQLRTEAKDEELLRLPPASVRNEDDIRWLPVIRHVLLFAKLLSKRKGVILSARGRDMLGEGAAGALFVRLFLTFFRQFDLQYLYGGEEHQGLQQTLAYSFYQLSRADNGWASSELLAEYAWLPSARDPMSEWERNHVDMRHYAFRYRVLDPLAHFGLLDRRVGSVDDPLRRSVEFRRTPLFDQLLRFTFHEPGDIHSPHYRAAFRTRYR